jgi:hypothetical protein
LFSKATLAGICICLENSKHLSFNIRDMGSPSEHFYDFMVLIPLFENPKFLYEMPYSIMDCFSPCSASRRSRIFSVVEQQLGVWLQQPGRFFFRNTGRIYRNFHFCF